MDRKDVSRLSTAFVDQGIASYAEPPAALVLDLDHADDPTYGQQEFAFYNHHSQHHGALPLCLFAGTSQARVTAALRPGTRPTGAEHAMIVVRLLSSLRRHGPATPILVRGARHCALPEVLVVMASSRWTAVGCGLAGTAVLLRQAAATLQEARQLHHHRVALAHAHGQAPPPSRRLSDEGISAAGSWTQPWRVLLKAEVMQTDDTPRLVVTSLPAPTPQRRYEDLSGARGTCEHAIKAVQHALHSDRTSAPSFLATAMRLLLACAASGLQPAFRTPTLPQTALAQVHPSTVLLTLCHMATQSKQDQDRMLLHLPRACPVKALCQRGGAAALRRPCTCLQHVLLDKTPPAAPSGSRVP